MLELELTGKALAESICALAADPEQVRRIGELAFTLARLDAARVIVDEMMDENQNIKVQTCTEK